VHQDCVSTLEYDYGTVLLTRLTRSYPPVTSVVRHNAARLTRAKLRRWTRRQEFHFYGGQNRKMYFQGSESTFISTQLLTRTLYEAATSHTSFTSAAGEGLARYRPCVVCLGRAVCDLSALRSPDRIRNMDSCLRQHVRNLLIINATYQETEVYNATEAHLEVERGSCPTEFISPHHSLLPRRLRETFFKWMLRAWIERMGRLDELVLPGMDIADIDTVLEAKWLIAIHVYFTKQYGAHRCGTPGGYGLEKGVRCRIQK
jgi:hypothetical protein